ncbi:uncharacterized protein B0T15DRAFT_528280 [Chaetomium strumarium]|uniref:Uncharacterized protein n=1 Tax=Chaetomium strumarium TaxID=1170767 RepID=A0AAJ0GVU5_9PEZI|nr:hypothetical protein B0T15DRAFT_528280 [Chaetomium strumarium]
MQKSKALGALLRIDQLRARQTRQLLSAVNSSIRARPNQERGFATGSTTSPPGKNPARTDSRSNDTASPAHREQGSARRVDRHLHDILNHPLFSPDERTIQANEDPSGYNAWSAQKTVFLKAVSRGLMTVQRAHGFLILVKHQVWSETARAGVPTPGASGAPPIHNAKDTASDARPSLKDTGAGGLVLQWLRSAGLEGDLLFLDNTKFRGLLLEFIVDEGLDHAVWAWIENLMGRVLSSKEDAAYRFEPLLVNYVEIKSRAAELEEAYSAVLKGEAMLQGTGLPNNILAKPWSTVTYHTTVNAWEHEKPPVRLFDPFVALGLVIPAPIVHRAHLDLYHPVNPSPNLAIEVLSGKSVWENIPTDTHRVRTSQWAQRINLLGVDTIQHLMRTDRGSEASRISDILLRHLAPIFGSSHKAAV